MHDRCSFERHDLLFLDRVDFHGTPGSPALSNWVRAGYPVIVRRPGLSAGGQGVHCGVPLPPGRGGVRLACVVPVGSLCRCAELPALRECLDVLPAPRRAETAEFLAACEEAHAVPEVFGSLAWQYITGLEYLRPESDIDLRFRVNNPAKLHQLAEVLRGMPSFAAGPADIEVELWNGMAFSWREFLSGSRFLLMKTINDVFLTDRNALVRCLVLDGCPDPAGIAFAVEAALREELESYPAPGLVSYVDRGSHAQMDASRFTAAIAALRSSFSEIAAAGGRGADMGELRQLGRVAEGRMLAATGGVNTHRGAIFVLGLLAAAAGYRSRRQVHAGLGTIVRERWGHAIIADERHEPSHGNRVARRYGCDGVRAEAAGGFPSVYGIGLPAFRRALRSHRRNAARVQALFAMLEAVDDTTLLFRGGLRALWGARAMVRQFNRSGGVDAPGWEERALDIHRRFVAEGWSCGGVADLLAATVFVHQMEQSWVA